MKTKKINERILYNANKDFLDDLKDFKHKIIRKHQKYLRQFDINQLTKVTENNLMLKLLLKDTHNFMNTFFEVVEGEEQKYLSNIRIEKLR